MAGKITAPPIMGLYMQIELEKQGINTSAEQCHALLLDVLDNLILTCPDCGCKLGDEEGA